MSPHELDDFAGGLADVIESPRAHMAAGPADRPSLP